jgi:hypothetical protein
MFELLLQTFWAKKNLEKILLISTLDKAIYYIGTFSKGSTKPFFTSQNRAETSRKKNSPVFFNMRIPDLDFYGSANAIICANRTFIIHQLIIQPTV